MTMSGEGPPSCPGRENACLKVGSINVTGSSALKRREFVENFEHKNIRT